MLLRYKKAPTEMEEAFMGIGRGFEQGKLLKHSFGSIF